MSGSVYFDNLAQGTAVTGVDEPGDAIPAAFRLEQNYPNPFNPNTGIRFQVSGVSHVDLRVFDLLGREVAVLANEVKQPGTYQASWNAAGMASGVYFYRLVAGSFVETKRMLLLK
jgi:hypothetical protein